MDKIVWKTHTVPASKQWIQIFFSSTTTVYLISFWHISKANTINIQRCSAQKRRWVFFLSTRFRHASFLHCTVYTHSFTLFLILSFDFHYIKQVVCSFNAPSFSPQNHHSMLHHSILYLSRNSNTYLNLYQVIHIQFNSYFNFTFIQLTN